MNPIEEIRELLAQLAVDVNEDIWYDSYKFEADFPNDGYSEAMDRIAAAPQKLTELFNQLLGVAAP